MLRSAHSFPLLASLAATLLSFSTSQSYTETFAQERPVISSATNKHDKAEDKPQSPEEAQNSFEVADDLDWELLLAEPEIAQPLQISFDPRGRMWVVEYRQYPRPAGLKVKSHDVYWRAVYDKVPPAPPHHDRGKDRISIHEDTNGDGTFDHHKVFVDGLNIATACAVSRKGVWVLNPPYLLFYPDENQDDIPDGPPEVHLSGFGLQDTHSVANSLTWGPDGWLYAAQGSTVTGEIKRVGIDEKPQISLGQNIWRYHPEKRIYEIFAEGGGNAFCVEIDREGRIFSGHNGGDTRGFHYVQGGFYRKGFSKHGPLSNPYAFGFFDSMDHHQVQRFTHSLLRYEDDLLPEQYRGKLFGVEPLQGTLVYADITPDGSTFTTKDIDRPISSSDSWFRPVEIKLGPDGAIYVADWYDGRVAHLFTMEEQVDDSRGRIYRLQPKGKQRPPLPNLAELSPQQLIDRLSDSNRTIRQLAVRELVEKVGSSGLPLIDQSLSSSHHPAALELLWARHQIAPFSDEELLPFCQYPDPHVRAWSIRLAFDDGRWEGDLENGTARLRDLIEKEQNAIVLSQFASSARRDARLTMPLTEALILFSNNTEDPHLPLLCWWNFESILSQHPAQFEGRFADWGTEFTSTSIFQNVIAERLAQRLVSSSEQIHWELCIEMFKALGNSDLSAQFVIGFEQALENRPLSELPDDLLQAVAELGNLPLPLELRLQKPGAKERALTILSQTKSSVAEKLPLIRTAAELKDAQLALALLEIAKTTASADLRVASWLALQGKLGESITLTSHDVPDNVATWSDRERTALCLAFASRGDWSKELVGLVSAGQLEKDFVSEDALLKMSFHRDKELESQISKIWGQLSGAATEEMVARVDYLSEVLEKQPGDPYPGKVLFNNRCAKCHELFQQGEYVGPGLTSYQRDNRIQLLRQIVNPSLEIREGFELKIVITIDGRILTGFSMFEDDNTLVLRGSEGEDVRILKEDIEEIVPQRKSLMPEGLLKDLTDKQVADLFAYLQSSQPLNN